MNCEKLDLCKTKESRCELDHTEGCDAGALGQVICKCKEGFMGVHCKEKRNACLENYDKTITPGFQACQPGACKAVLGTNMYTCACKTGYTDDPNYPHNDCYKREDACKTIICRNGFCRVSGDRKTAICVCDTNYEGTFCEIAKPHWNAWREWGECSPTCGKVRIRARMRTCSRKDAPCVGEDVDEQKCSRSVCKVVDLQNGATDKLVYIAESTLS